MLGAPNNFVRDSSFYQSFYRCISIHGTDSVSILRNTAFEIRGSCYYLEDGVEENNLIAYNFGGYVLPIGGAMLKDGGQGGEVVDAISGLLQPADRAPAAFYISNAFNRIIGNAASGGFAGFSFPGLPVPIGASRTRNVKPIERPVLEFNGNSAHSAGTSWPFTGCFYVGGVLEEKGSSGSLRYTSGRARTQDKKNNGVRVFSRFSNLQAFLCNYGFSHWGDRPELVGFEITDVNTGAQLFGDGWLGNGIINAESTNVDRFPSNTIGFQGYDVTNKALVSNVLFRNFLNDRSVTGMYDNNRCVIGMTHSDVFKPQSLVAVSNLRYENVDFSVRYGIGPGSRGALWTYNFIDWTGESVNRPGQASIIGSATYNWFNFDSSCQKNTNWNAWICPKGTREIAQISPIVPGLMYTQYNTDNSATIVAYMTLWGRNVPSGSTVPVTKQPGVTGVSGNIGWKLFLASGNAPQGTWKIHLNTIVQGTEIYFATPYPRGSSFNIRGFRGPGSNDGSRAYSQAQSVAEVWNGDGFKFFFDGSFLYIKLINPFNNKAAFERDGAKIYEPNINGDFWLGNSWALQITSTCGGGSCRVADALPPPSAYWN
jgi:hypothetical protein